MNGYQPHRPVKYLQLGHNILQCITIQAFGYMEEEVLLTMLWAISRNISFQLAHGPTVSSIELCVMCQLSKLLEVEAYVGTPPPGRWGHVMMINSGGM